MKKVSSSYLISAAALLTLSACSFSEPLPEEQAGDLNYKAELFATETFTDVKAVKTAKKAKKKTFKDEESFVVSSVSDAALSQMRGGFLSASGLKIDFGYYSGTLVNGSLASNFSYTTSSIGVQSSVPMSINNIVQNNVDSQVIQNINVLDVTVSNMSAYRDLQFSNNIRLNAISR